MRHKKRYLPEVVKAGLTAGPGLHHINVAHDDWCDLLAGCGPCNCSPEVSTPIPHDEWQRRQTEPN